jgi:hypothetical protein
MQVSALTSMLRRVLSLRDYPALAYCDACAEPKDIYGHNTGVSV